MDRSAYKTLTSAAELKEWCARAIDQGLVAFDTETTSVNAMSADLVGVSLALAPGEACSFPAPYRG